MGGLGHSEVSSTWVIPSPSYIKSSKLHTTTFDLKVGSRSLLKFYNSVFK
jgi:hypothetical protein